MENSEHDSVASASLQGLEMSWTFTTTAVERWESCNAWNKEEESRCLLAYTQVTLQKCPPMIHSDEDTVTLEILFVGTPYI